MTNMLDLAVIGGGAAGYFAALQAGATFPKARIAIFEAGRRPLEKVRISGGGRCNVTHHCFDPSEFAEHYPRGSKELRSAFHRFQAEDTVKWFTERGVPLKVEPDGRMFPTSDNSESIIECLENTRQNLNIALQVETRVRSISKRTEGGFTLEISQTNCEPTSVQTRHVLLASGGNKSGYEFAKTLGHTITPLAPSLFTFNIPDPTLQALAGVSVEASSLELLIDGAKVAQHAGPLLITHWGVSGPAVLKLSAWAARELQAAHYQAKLRVNWAPSLTAENILVHLEALKSQRERKTVLRSPQFNIPQRLWEYLVQRSIPTSGDRTWAHVDKKSLQLLSRALAASDLAIQGKGQFKEEFVTCGGVALAEVDFRTMESKRTQGLYFAGEVLDIDGITGGFNFQAAWTTGWIAGSAIGRHLVEKSSKSQLN